MTLPAHSLKPPGADMSELNLAKGTSIDFPQGKDKLLVFNVTIKPDEGMYKQVANVPTSYPHDAPKVKCQTKVSCC